VAELHGAEPTRMVEVPWAVNANTTISVASQTTCAQRLVAMTPAS
jgi:hypothetical protein